MNKLKKGLTYISERGSFYRYSDKVQDEKWLQPLSEYIPLETIMRGQPVSIATEKDIKRASELLAASYNEGKDEDSQITSAELYSILMEDSHTFVVLTRPDIHKNSIGLSYEYTPGPAYDAEKETIVFSDMIHILDIGRFDIDPDYLLKSHQIASGEELAKDVIGKEEYLPDFFKESYTKLIGQQIYVKGRKSENDLPGILTIVPEDAYLGYNNIIKIGFISDAWLNGTNISELKAILEKAEVDRTNDEKEKLKALDRTSENAEEFLNNSVSIQVQIQGDDRGALDSTLFEGKLGEPVTISSNSPIRVFALGQEDDVAFKARINITPTTTQEINKETAFIGFQKMDGKTTLVSFGPEFSITKAKDSGVTEDAAFLTIANIYDPTFYTTCKPHEAKYINNFGANITLTQDSLAEAITKAWKDLTGFDMTVKSFQNIVADTTAGYIEIESDQPGGYYYMYISEDLHRVFLQDSFTITNGSSYNKGTVVLADNRIAARQNIIGVFMSGIYDEPLEVGRQYIFMHDGLFRHSTSNYQEIGKEYFLGRHGFVTRLPDTAYETVVKVLDVQDSEKLLIHCDNMRVKTRGGDLPLGYIKPAVKAGDKYLAEYGFVLMDGETTYDKDGYKALYERLQTWYPKSVLDAVPDTAPANSFIIPLCTTVTEDGGEHTILQIKSQEYGIYEKEPRVPYVRKIGTFETESKDKIITVDGKEYLPGNCVPMIGVYSVRSVGEDKSKNVVVDTRFDVTPIVDLCIMESSILEPSIESLDIRLFVDPAYDPEHDSKYHWVEIRNGFQNFNNNTSYGFEWKLDKEDPTNDCPFGRYFLSTDIKDGMGIYYQKSGNLAPTRLSGMPWKLMVTRRETVAQQYDLDGVMHAYLRNRTVDEEGNAYTTKAVTGAAVIDAIENRYYVRNLVARPHIVDPITGEVTQDSHILLGRENEPATEVGLSSVNELKIHGVNGIKFENTTKEGEYQEDHKIVVKDNWISVEKGHNDLNEEVDLPKFSEIKGNEFTTKDQVLEHITKDATLGVDSTRNDNTKVVHGMIFGPRGNVNASTFNGLPLGRHHSARVIAGEEREEVNDNEENHSYLTYLYYGSDPIKDNQGYLTNLEGKIIHNRPSTTQEVDKAIKGVYSVTGYSDKVNTGSEDYLTYEEIINNNYSVFHHKVTGKYRKAGEQTVDKTLEIKYNFSTKTSETSGSDKLLTPDAYDFEFVKKIEGEDEAPASVKVGAIGITSKADFKRLYGESVNTYPSTTSIDTLIGNRSQSIDAFGDKSSKEYLGSALQAAYEMPLAFWQYTSEPNWYKKYIGIVIERVNDMRDNLSKKTDRAIFDDKDQHYWAGQTDGKYNDPKSSKPFNSDDNTYHYSQEELTSISNYLNAVTDNAESAQNIISSVGLLFKAAKETQERLLKVEASTFGADAPTIPGQTKNFVFPETPDVTPEATHLGLNRLIRAMAIELYGTANPDDNKLKDINESNNTSTTLSRLDTLEVELEGKTFDTGVDTDAADNVLTSNSATYPYEVNYETAHGGITTVTEQPIDVYPAVTQDETTKKLTYHSVVHDTILEVKAEDIVYYKNKNDLNAPYKVYDGDRVTISIPKDGDELYVKETYIKVLGNQNPIDGRAAIKDETEDSENHGTWTKINFNKATKFEQVNGKFIADTTHNLVPEENRNEFNGTIDAISRICTKVNALTYTINGKDNINSTPERLNTIRNNIETLIKEAYFDGVPETTVTPATSTTAATTVTEERKVSQAYIDEDLDHTDSKRTLFHQPSQPYELKKAKDGNGKDYTGLSRFDQLSKDLYDYVIGGFDNSKNTVYTNVNSENNGTDLADKTHTAIQYTTEDDVKNKGASKKQVLAGRTFNGKKLLIDGESNSDGVDVTRFNQTHSDNILPTTFHINVPDSIEEYQYASIIDILIDALGTGYFRYQISKDSDTTSEDLRPTETITSRIEAIEKALDNVSHKLSQKKFFEGDTTKEYNDYDLFEGSSSKPTYSIESFIENLNNWLGLSTLSNTDATWDQSISAEVACGYSTRSTEVKDRYFIVTGTAYVDNNDNFQEIDPATETLYAFNSTDRTYHIATAEEKTAGVDMFVKREVADETDYLNNADPIVNSNYVIKQLLKRLRKEESYYTILTEILGKDYDIEKAKGSVKIVIDPKTGLQKIEGDADYTLTDDIKDLLLTIYGTDERVSRNGVQTTYEHRSNIEANAFITAYCWVIKGAETPETAAKVYTSVQNDVGSTIWTTPAFSIYKIDDETYGHDREGTIASLSTDKNEMTSSTGTTYVRYALGDAHETADNNNTRFTGNSTTRNIIDDILKETYYVPDPVRFVSTETTTNNSGTNVTEYTNTPVYPEDSADVKYNTNHTYYDFDKKKYHYDYEHDSDDIRGGAVGKAIGYQNRDSLFKDYKGVENRIHSETAGIRNDSEYRRSRFEVLEDEIRHLRQLIGIDEIIGDNSIGDQKASETVYGGHFYGTSDTDLAGHTFSGGATRNGNFFAKANAAHVPNSELNETTADSNLLTMVFNLSNALRDISRELGTETNYHGQRKSEVNNVTLDYDNFEQLNKEREMPIYERLNSLEDITGSLLGWANKTSSQGGEGENEEDQGGVLNIQWI